MTLKEKSIDHSKDCECLLSGSGEKFDCSCDYKQYIKLNEMIEAMKNENRIDNDIVISEGRLRDYIEKYLIN